MYKRQDLGQASLWGSVESLLLGTPPTIDLTTTLFGSINTTRTIYGQVLGGQASAQPGAYQSNFTAAGSWMLRRLIALTRRSEIISSAERWKCAIIAIQNS